MHNTSSQIHEKLVYFILCSDGVSGQALTDLIVLKLRHLGLDPESKLRGQAYDCAGNMVGRLQGCSTLIQQQFPKALYMHCIAHCLNLCIVSPSKIVDVKSMWAALVVVNIFYKYSSKRSQSHADEIEEMSSHDEGQDFAKRKLVDLCKMSWVAYHNTLVTFSALFPAVVSNFDGVSQNIGGNWNGSSVTAAASLLNCITQFKFIGAFTVVSKVLSYIHALQFMPCKSKQSTLSKLTPLLPESWTD